MGGDILKYGDTLRFINPNHSIQHRYAVKIFPNNQTTTGLIISKGTNSIQLGVVGSNILNLYSQKVKVESLKGNGNAFVCVHSNGILYRSNNPCKPYNHCCVKPCCEKPCTSVSVDDCCKCCPCCKNE